MGKVKRRVNCHLWTAILTLLWCLPLQAAKTDYPWRIIPLVDPEKLATVGSREADGRIQQTVHWRAEPRHGGRGPDAPTFSGKTQPIVGPAPKACR